MMIIMVIFVSDVGYLYKPNYLKLRPVLRIYERCEQLVLRHFLEQSVIQVSPLQVPPDQLPEIEQKISIICYESNFVP